MSESYAERARRTRSDELRSTLRLCEERLRKLKKPADAWRLFEVVWDGTPRPGMGKTWEAKEALGKEWDTIEGPRPPRNTPGTDAFSQAVRDVAATEGISLFEAWSVVTVRQPRLYARYQHELRRTFGNVRHREPYRHAEVAALMAAALEQERLDDPVAMFAAGLALGEYHQYDHQRHFAQRSRQELIKRIGEQTCDRQAAGGRSKLGKVLPHTKLIRRALCFDSQQNDRGEDWRANEPARRTPTEVVALFADEDVVRDLIEHQPRVAVTCAWFDKNAKALAFEYSDGTNRKVKVASLPSIIGRLVNS